MEKYRYWSKTNQQFIRIYIVQGEFEVRLFYEDLTFFKTMSTFELTRSLQKGDIVEGWEEGE